MKSASIPPIVGWILQTDFFNFYWLGPEACSEPELILKLHAVRAVIAQSV
jgi:hypothetical protein